jgi:hypothetical protein
MNTLGKMLTGLAVMASASCAPRPVVYARQDYGLGMDKEVALYNIDKILHDSRACNKGGYADTAGFGCDSTHCLKTERRVSKQDMGGGNYSFQTTDVCINEALFISSCSWDGIISVEEKEGNCLTIKCNYGIGGNPLCLADFRQKNEFKQALDIYLHERRK